MRSSPCGVRFPGRKPSTIRAGIPWAAQEDGHRRRVVLAEAAPVVREALDDRDVLALALHEVVDVGVVLEEAALGLVDEEPLAQVLGEVVRVVGRVTGLCHELVEELLGLAARRDRALRERLGAVEPLDVGRVVGARGLAARLC